MNELIINSDWEIKLFDLKLINNLARNHPYQKIMFLVYEYYDSYIDESEGDILYDIDYFKLLNRYYRYGITFEDDELYPKKRILYEKENFNKFGIDFEDGIILPELLYVHEDFKRIKKPFRYILKNEYNLKQLIYNDVKKINLVDLYIEPITLSEVEKWKKK